MKPTKPACPPIPQLRTSFKFLENRPHTISALYVSFRANSATSKMSSLALPSNPAENTGPSLQALTIVLTSASVVVMSLRLYVRAAVIQKIGADVSHMCYHVFLPY